jgi:hypothetical protein
VNAQTQFIEQARALYGEVLRTSNHFLHNCGHFSVEVLQDEDPSYADLAKVMSRIAVIITLLADEFDPMMGQKAFEYCELMTRMGIAINEGNQVVLTQLTAELARRPGV